MTYGVKAGDQPSPNAGRAFAASRGREISSSECTPRSTTAGARPGPPDHSAWGRRRPAWGSLASGRITTETVQGCLAPPTVHQPGQGKCVALTQRHIVGLEEQLDLAFQDDEQVEGGSSVHRKICSGGEVHHSLLRSDFTETHVLNSRIIFCAARNADLGGKVSRRQACARKQPLRHFVQGQALDPRGAWSARLRSYPMSEAACRLSQSSPRPSKM